MHLVLAAVLAVATTPPPAEPVAVFEEWASENGTPVRNSACDEPQGGEIICYGLIEGSGGSVVIVGVAARDDDGAFSSFSVREVVPPSTTTTIPPSTTAAPTTTAVPTTTIPIDDPLLPMEVGANGPAVAALQARIGVGVDCGFGNQTRAAVEQWQATAGIEVTGAIDLPAWQLLDVPTTWGDDANGNGAIEPSEVTLVCGGIVELPEAPPPTSVQLDTTGWPATLLASVAATCSIPDEFASAAGEPDVRYDPGEDMITIIGAGAADSERGAEVFDTMVCVLAYAAAPERVVSQISAPRAQERDQFALWEGMVAQWRFDEAAGLDLTIYSTAPAEVATTVAG